MPIRDLVDNLIPEDEREFDAIDARTRAEVEAVLEGAGYSGLDLDRSVEQVMQIFDSAMIETLTECVAEMFPPVVPKVLH